MWSQTVNIALIALVNIRNIEVQETITMPEHYPRDLVGYGRNTPDPRWPNQARVAVQFVINYEEGGENCILHGDVTAEAFLSEIIGA